MSGVQETARIAARQMIMLLGWSMILLTVVHDLFGIVAFPIFLHSAGDDFVTASHFAFDRIVQIFYRYDLIFAVLAILIAGFGLWRRVLPWSDWVKRDPKKTAALWAAPLAFFLAIIPFWLGQMTGVGVTFVLSGGILFGVANRDAASLAHKVTASLALALGLLALILYLNEHSEMANKWLQSGIA